MPNPTYVPVLRQGADVSFATIAVTGNGTVGGTLGVTGNTTLGGTLAVTGVSTFTGALVINGGGAWAGLMDAAGATAATSVLGTLVTGDTVDRLRVRADGQHDWGPGGAGVRDTTLRRSAAGVLATDGSFSLATVGGGLLIKEGANATSGVATLAAGTVTVNTTKVTATSRVQLTVQSLGTVTAPKAIGVTARTAGTSFTITSADATDTSVVAWTIIEPAP